MLAEPLPPLGALEVLIGNSAAVGVAGASGIGPPLPLAAISGIETVSDPPPGAVLMVPSGDALPAWGDFEATPGPDCGEPGSWLDGA